MRTIKKNVQRTYTVEVICNKEKESERVQTLQPILDHFMVEPLCTVWGEEARGHELFSTFRIGTHINAVSLAINHIEAFRRNMNNDCYLLVLESDVLPLYDMNDVSSCIEETVEEMKTHSIDFCFIGEGCFNSIHPETFFIPLRKKTNTIFLTQHSRCTESYIVSPRGIQEFLRFIQTFNMTVIDFTFNSFFERHDVVSSWRIPELFRQGTATGLYKGSIPFSTL